MDDSNSDKQLTRKYSNKLFIVVGILLAIVCIINLFETFFSQNYIAMAITYVISTITLIVFFVLTDKENNKVEEQLSKERK